MTHLRKFSHFNNKYRSKGLLHSAAITDVGHLLMLRLTSVVI